MLNATSSHPAPLIASIPYGQYLRLKRNCSEGAHFESEARALRLRLRLRGYSNRCLKIAYLKAKNKDRSALIHDRQTPISGLRFITRFSGQHKQIRAILEKYWYLLKGDAKVSKHLKDFPEITFRRSQSLRDTLVHSHYAPKSLTKTRSRCTRPCHKCNFCCHLYASSHINLPNGRLYRPNFLVTCQLKVLYIAWFVAVVGFMLARQNTLSSTTSGTMFPWCVGRKWRRPLAVTLVFITILMIPTCIFLP